VRLTSRRSQPPLAVSVPLSRFTSRVGGGSAFFVRPLMIDIDRIRPSHLRCCGAVVHATSRGQVQPTLFRNLDRPIFLPVRCFWRAMRRWHLSPLLPVVRFLFAYYLFVNRHQWPNKSPEPTTIGAFSESASVAGSSVVIVSWWLSFFR
jgi:hypothetical protein